MNIKDANLKAESLCARQSLKFISVVDAKDNALYVHAISRDEYGEIWRMDFKDGEHTLSERVLRFALDVGAQGDLRLPDIPLCVIEDAARLRDYLTNRDGPGLAVDHVDYTRPFTPEGEA